MSSGARIASRDAAATAKRFLSLIEGATERIVIAGSLRRRLPYCRDIEFVCTPKVEIERTETVGLFGSEYSDYEVDRLDQRMNQLLADGIVEKRILSDGSSTRWGPLAKYLVFEGAPVDLFATDADRFGWTLALRTGPSEFSRQIVQSRELKTKDRRQGLLPAHLTVDGGLRSRLSGELIPTPDEDAVFSALGIDYREPWQRR